MTNYFDSHRCSWIHLIYANKKTKYWIARSIEERKQQWRIQRFILLLIFLYNCPSFHEAKTMNQQMWDDAWVNTQQTITDSPNTVALGEQKNGGKLTHDLRDRNLYLERYLQEKRQKKILNREHRKPSKRLVYP